MGAGGGDDISIIHACKLNCKKVIHYSSIITLHCTGNKFLQSGLEENKYNSNKYLNHATLIDAVHYATFQNTEPTIYQETSTSSDQDQIFSIMYL